MLRDAVKALGAGLAGAGLLAFVDGLLQLADPGRGMVRELATLAVGGAWLVTGAVVLLLCLGAALLRRPLPRPGTAFWLGWAVALAPITWAVLSPKGGLPTPSPLLVAIPSLLVAAAAPWLGRRLYPARLGGVVVAFCAALLLLAPSLHPTGYDGRIAPRYQPRADAAQPPAGAPDVVLISIDTLRADAVLGPDAAAVPHLDALRDSGFYADYALSTSNQTLPGHVGMLTGLDATGHGVRSNIERPRSELKLVSQYFQDGGYATAGVISNGLLSHFEELDRGYDAYDDSLVRWSLISHAMGSATDRNTWLGWLLDEQHFASILRNGLLRALLEGRKGGGTGEPVTTRAVDRIHELGALPRPYFLFVHLMDAHMPYPRPEAWRGRYTAALPRPGPQYVPADDRAIQQPYLRKAQADLKAGVPEAAAARDYYHAVYREVVSYMDDCVGRVLDAARATGRPTVVLFTADHGEQFGEHGLFEHANSQYEPLLRVPFIVGFVNWRGEPPARGRLSAGVTLPDVTPTLLGLAGLAPSGLSGRPAWQKDGVLVHVSTDDQRISARYGSLKWIGAWNGDEAPRSLALFDLEKDPQELHNLLEDQVQPPAELLQAVVAARDHDTHGLNKAAGAEQQAALSELGYGGELAQPEPAEPGLEN